MRVRYTYLLSVLLLVSSFSVHAQSERQVNWLTFEQLNDSLTNNPKPVLIFFHTQWCGYCKKMLAETFSDEKVVKRMSSYYAVKFDAESVDTIFFDGIHYTNSVRRKTTGKNHQLAKILMGMQKKLIFPATILLNEDFTIRSRKFNYLSTKQLLNIL